MNLRALDKRVKVVSASIGELGSILRAARDYAHSDPHSSLTKSRIVLERALCRIYQPVTGKTLKRPMLGDILSDGDFCKKLPVRIRARMNFVRELSNAGPHGGEATETDALHVLQDLVDVLEWYALSYPQHAQITAPAVDAEMLTALSGKYPGYIRPNITSVKFRQTAERCMLEITTSEELAGYLKNEKVSRTDLGFISDGDGPSEPYFDPKRPLAENVHKFVHDFDEVSIVNCTDLFTDEATTRVFDEWKRHAKSPDAGPTS